MRKNGACCYYYSDGHPGRRLKLASSSFLKTFVVGAVTTFVGRSFHKFTTLWLNVNLRNSSLDRFFFIIRECPRSLEVSAIWMKSRHWTPSRDPWKILYIIMSPLFILQDIECNFSNWTLSSYSDSLRHFTSLAERRWTSSYSLVSFFSPRRQAWTEFSKWGRMNAPYNSWERADVISMNNDFIALIIEFTFFAAFAHWRLGLSGSSTITSKSRWWLTHTKHVLHLIDIEG